MTGIKTSLLGHLKIGHCDMVFICYGLSVVIIAV
jgi:hypothetical protein